MKYIIALKGKSNSGKTSTFYILGDLMRNSGYALKEGNFEEKFERDRKRGDYWQIFEKKGQLIGVVSAGDLYEIVRKQLDSLDTNHHCDIALCTCRSFDKVKPGTVQAVTETPGFEEPFIKKERAVAGKEEEENQKSAVALLQRIEGLLKA